MGREKEEMGGEIKRVCWTKDTPGWTDGWMDGQTDGWTVRWTMLNEAAWPVCPIRKSQSRLTVHESKPYGIMWVGSKTHRPEAGN